MHTYNTQEASQKAINAAFSRKVDSLVSLCRYLYILSKVCLLLCSSVSWACHWDSPARRWEQRTYVFCWRATILLFLSPCRLQSLSSSVAFRLCLSISVPRQNVWSCFIEYVLHIVPGPGVRTHNLRVGPNNKTFYKHTYIHLPSFWLHTARSLASLPARQLRGEYSVGGHYFFSLNSKGTVPKSLVGGGTLFLPLLWREHLV